MLLADTSLVPDDGLTAGSRTTPSTVPAVRRGAAAAREFLQSLACQRWQVKPAEVVIQDGRFTNRQTNETLTYAELATEEDLSQALDRVIPGDISVTPVQEWKVMGRSPARPGLRDYVTGASISLGPGAERWAAR